MSEEDGDVPTNTNDTRKARKIRPEREIYRPGMMQKRKDITAIDHPPSSAKIPDNSKRRSSKLYLESRSTGRLSEDSSSRRQSNDTDSVHSYRGDSGSTTPDAASLCGDRRDSGCRGGYRSLVRGGQRNDGPTNNRRYVNRKSTSSYQGLKEDSNCERGHRRSQTYDSTQSLYDSRCPGGYLDYKFSTNTLDHLRRGGRFQHQAMDRNVERASMRAEPGQRRVYGRKRNDSINSTQSERPPNNTDLLNVGNDMETQSQLGEPSSSLSYLQLCKSFESIGSFDWSQEVESEYNAKLREEEEKKTKELQERLEACSNGLEVENALSHNRSNVRGILRLTISDNSPHPVVSISGARNSHSINRIRHDSDRSSSIGGSIAEGCESGDEGSGEKTPTKVKEDSRWSSLGGRRTAGGRFPGRRMGTYNNPHSARYDGEYGSEDRYKESQWSRDFKQFKYRGEHDFNREMPSVPHRLRGRSSVENGNAGQNAVRQSMLKERGRPYEPPAMRGSDQNGGVSKQSVDGRDSPKSMPTLHKQMSDFAVYQDIAKDEGPKIRQINDEIADLLLRVCRSKDVSAARKLLPLSSNLSEIYYGILTRDVNFTFSMNLEQHLWKQAYHKLIEALRTASNSIKDGAKALRTLLLSLLQTGIEFYKRLLKRYESDFDLLLSSALLWPSGLPSDDFEIMYIGCHPAKQYDKGRQKLAIKSCARHLIALGDLNRYKTLVEGSEDYSHARVCYLQSIQLWPASGHGYNQLGVVAFFSERVLDEIYFCIRALTAGHPFEAARERLYARLAALKKKVEKYEQILDSDCGRVHAEVELAERADRPRELWLSIDGSVEAAEGKNSDVYASFLEQSPSKLHRRTISYIVNTAGLLITKIGMETFASISERAICQLAALIDQNGSPITSIQLVQISLLFIYAVHTTEVSGDEDTCSLQQQIALRTLVSVLGVLLRPINQQQGDLQFWLTGQKEIPFKIMRVLPAVCIISEWLSCSMASAVYCTMPSVEPLSMSVLSIDTWQYMTDLANALVSLENEKILGNIEEVETSTPCLLPELVFVSSFLSIFPSSARQINYAVHESDHKDEVLLTLHVRLSKFLLAAEYLNKSELGCLSFLENEGKFVKNEPHDNEKLEEKRKHTDVERCDKFASPRVTNREELLEREQRKKQTVMVVRPVNLVPDTNAFVDHLDYIHKIVASGRFQIIVPTIVIEELIGLSQNRPKEVEDPHVEFVMAQARRAVTWLKERAREKCAKMKTLTTQGQTLAISIVSEDTGSYDARKVNDDHILQSCISFVERTPVIVSSDVNPTCFESDVPPIHRNLVLLTEDRGLNIKATSQNIPCRTVPSFMKWAKIN